MAFAALEQVDQEEPDLLHPLGRRAHLAIEVLVGLIQRPGEGLELLPVVGTPPRSFRSKAGSAMAPRPIITASMAGKSTAKTVQSSTVTRSPL